MAEDASIEGDARQGMSDDWMHRLQGRADEPAATPRDTLWAPGATARIGCIEPSLATRMADAGLPLHDTGDGWQVDAPLGASLDRIARWLRTHLLNGRWRNEQLAVTDPAGRVLGAIERAAVRPLGIATHAVHLVGYTIEGAVWVQQRALDKATDPGRWDTLMGGLMAAGESVQETLERETWEEAGLSIGQLREVTHFGGLTVRRPVAEGYMVEHIQCFDALVPAGLRPVNQDGEVVRFEALDSGALVERLRADEFTVEAALVLLRWRDRGAQERR